MTSENRGCPKDVPSTFRQCLWFPKYIPESAMMSRPAVAELKLALLRTAWPSSPPQKKNCDARKFHPLQSGPIFVAPISPLSLGNIPLSAAGIKTTQFALGCLLKRGVGCVWILWLTSPVLQETEEWLRRGGEGEKKRKNPFFKNKQRA